MIPRQVHTPIFTALSRIRGNLRRVLCRERGREVSYQGLDPLAMSTVAAMLLSGSSRPFDYVWRFAIPSAGAEPAT